MIKKVLVVVGVVLIIGLTVSTIIFATKASSLQSDKKQLEQERKAALEEISSHEDDIAKLENAMLDISKDLMRSAGILMNTGVPTQEFLDLYVKISEQIGQVTGELLVLGGASEEEIDETIKELEQEAAISR